MTLKIKQFLWFLFKSPQRKMVGWTTLLVDVKGSFSLFVHQLFSASLKPITICTGLYNRSDNYLNIVLDALNKMDNKEFVRLSVYDCGSDDVNDLEQKIKERWKGDLIFESEKVNFSRAYSFNKAIDNAETELLLILDSDISVPKNMVSQINTKVSKYNAWFPMVNWEEKNGKYRLFSEGTGICASLKSQFLQVGKYNEEYKEWGKEDWDLFFSYYKNGLYPHRTFEKDWIHHYHDRNIPTDFEKMF